jgi:hypothetical protein
MTAKNGIPIAQSKTGYLAEGPLEWAAGQGGRPRSLPVLLHSVVATSELCVRGSDNNDFHFKRKNERIKTIGRAKPK